MAQALGFNPLSHVVPGSGGGGPRRPVVTRSDPLPPPQGASETDRRAPRPGAHVDRRTAALGTEHLLPPLRSDIDYQVPDLRGRAKWPGPRPLSPLPEDEETADSLPPVQGERGGAPRQYRLPRGQAFYVPGHGPHPASGGSHPLPPRGRGGPELRVVPGSDEPTYAPPLSPPPVATGSGEGGHRGESASPMTTGVPTPPPQETSQTQLGGRVANPVSLGSEEYRCAAKTYFNLLGS